MWLQVVQCCVALAGAAGEVALGDRPVRGGVADDIALRRAGGPPPHRVAPALMWGAAWSAYNRSSVGQKLEALLIAERRARRGSAATSPAPTPAAPTAARRLDAAGSPTPPPGWQYANVPGVVDRAHRCQPAGDPINKPANRSEVWQPYHESDLKPHELYVCHPGTYFKCGDQPVCHGDCPAQSEPWLLFRCYTGQVCMDASCKCICGPAWTMHPDCEKRDGGPPCEPPKTPHGLNFAGCCCTSCHCPRDWASSRVDGCCSCKQCPGLNKTGQWMDGDTLRVGVPTRHWSSGMGMQCLAASDAAHLAPSLWVCAAVALVSHLLTAA